MRKIFKNMAWTMAATLVMAACSDSLDESDNTGQGPLTGEGYVKVAINMPSASSTRAFNESNDLNDGIEKEWTVKNGIIAFFEGGKNEVEGNAKFVKAYDLGTPSNNLVGNDNQISNKPYSSQTLNAPVLSNDDNQMYALVILNNGNNSSLASVDNEGKRLTLKNGDAPIILESGTSTFKDLDGAKWALNSTDITSDANGFLMLNAPLYYSNTQNAGDSNNGKTQTLVPVTVYSDETEAEKYPVNIYVERIVAKVDVSISNLVQIGTDTNKKGLAVKDNSVYNGDQVVFVDNNNGAEPLGWVLNVTNKNAKPLRNVSEITNWLKLSSITNRDFIGTTSVEGNWKRIYWAIDNNYDGTSSDTDFNIYRSNSTESSLPTDWGKYSTGTDAGATIYPQYCLENTAPAADMKENNTTCVLIKAIYLVDGIEDTEDRSFFMIGDNAVTLSKTEFLSKIETTLGITELSNITLGIDEDVDGGYYKGAGKLKELITGLESSGTTYDDKLNSLDEIRYYKDGGCYYYSVPIQHFEIAQPTGQEVSDDNFLGGYGVVRNNWYQIQIKSVSGPGEPGVDPGEEPIVKDEGYIQCTINVLSWAKRSQGVDL